MDINRMNVSELSESLRSNDVNKQLLATRRIRFLLSMENAPPINEVINCGYVPTLIQFMTREENPQLQFEACWAVSNICSGTSEHTKTVLRMNAVPIFVKLVSHTDENVREQAIWGIGNIIGDSSQSRDYVLKCGVFPLLLKVIEDRPRVSLLRTAVWCLSNCFRGKPLVEFSYAVKALPLLSFLLYNTDVEVLNDTCWALSYISDGPNRRIQMIIESNTLKRLLEIAKSPTYAIALTPVVKIIGNITSGSNEQTQTVIQCGCLEIMLKLLTHENTIIRKEVLWTISNVLAGNQSQIQEILNTGIMKKVISHFIEGKFDFVNFFQERRQAMFCITNLLAGGTDGQVVHLISLGVMKSFCDIYLSSEDVETVSVCLDGIKALGVRERKLGELEYNKEEEFGVFSMICDAVKGLKKRFSEEKGNDRANEAMGLLK